MSFGNLSATALSVLAFFLSASLGGCATQEILNAHPSRTIERPYVLPKGLAAVEAGGGMQHQQFENDYVRELSGPLIFPGLLRLPVAEHWNLLLFVILPGFQYELPSEAGTSLGISFFLKELNLSSIGGVSAEATASLWFSRKHGDHFAMRGMLVLGGGANFSFGKGKASGGLLFSPTYQFTDALAVGPIFGITVGQDGRQYFLSQIPVVDIAFETAAETPLGIFAEAVIGARWTISAEYLRQDPIGPLSPLHSAMLRAAYLW